MTYVGFLLKFRAGNRSFQGSTCINVQDSVVTLKNTLKLFLPKLIIIIIINIDYPVKKGKAQRQWCTCEMSKFVYI